MSGFEILEHTADVGARAYGDSLEEVFEQATRAMCEIAGVWHDGGVGEELSVSVESDDLGALLVDWLSEVLYLHEIKRCALARVLLNSVGPRRAEGAIVLTPLGDEAAEGTQVKAITYHRLRVARTEHGHLAEVYFDI